MNALVRYDAMCRAIDAAYAVDEVKAIHDQAQMLQAAARVAQNTEAEDLAYQIRMRAARKANQLYDAGEKATGGDAQRARSGHPTESPKTLSDLGMSKQEMSEWRKLNSIPGEQFEEGLANGTLSELLAKPTPVSDGALLFIGTMRDFERRGYLAGAPADFMATMTETMLAEVHRIAPLASAWLARVGEDDE